MYVSHSGESYNKMVLHALDALVTFFFICAVILQLFEWNLITSLIYHQGTTRHAQLDVMRERFNQSERLKWKVVRLVIYAAFAFNLSKVVLSMITMYLCAYDEDGGECQI